MAKQLTLSQLTAELYRLLTTRVETIKVQRVAHGESAGCTYDKEARSDIAVRVDHVKDGILGSVVHELLHYALDTDLGRLSYSVQEPMIGGLEDEIWHHILKRRGTTEKWRRAIEVRLR